MRITTPLLCGIFAAGLASTHAADTAAFTENFAQATEHSAVKNTTGWSVHAGPGDAKIQLAAGYEGLGARVETNEQLRLLIPPDQAIDLSEGGAEFHIKLRIMASNDGYALTQVLLGQDDGVHGVIVRFNGGTKDGAPDNFLQISSSGESWGRAFFEDLPDTPWKKETWYEIIITFTSAQDAKVTVRDADSGLALIEDRAIGVVGLTGKFEKLNVVVIGNGGTARAFDFDDISLIRK